MEPSFAKLSLVEPGIVVLRVKEPILLDGTIPASLFKKAIFGNTDLSTEYQGEFFNKIPFS